MPSGAAVIRYEGKRGVTWRVKYADADGRQVMETLGREPEWDRRKAERALGARLDDVVGIRLLGLEDGADEAARGDVVVDDEDLLGCHGEDCTGFAGYSTSDKICYVN